MKSFYANIENMIILNAPISELFVAVCLLKSLKFQVIEQDHYDDDGDGDDDKTWSK